MWEACSVKETEVTALITALSGNSFCSGPAQSLDVRSQWNSIRINGSSETSESPYNIFQLLNKVNEAFPPEMKSAEGHHDGKFKSYQGSKRGMDSRSVLVCSWAYRSVPCRLP